MKLSIAPVKSEDTKPAIDTDLEAVRLSFSGRGKPKIAYAPDAAPRRFAVEDEVLDMASVAEDMYEAERAALVQPPIQVKMEAQKESFLSLFYVAGLVLAGGWVVLAGLFPDSPALAAIQDHLTAMLPGFVIVLGFGALLILDRQESRRLTSWRQALNDVFAVEGKQLKDQAKDARGLARSLGDVQLQMRGVNTQLWVLQKNIGDISQLKSDLEFLGQELSTFSTVSRRTIMDWEAQLVQAGSKLEGLERTTTRLSQDSLENASFLSDRLEETKEQLQGLNDLHDLASQGTRDLTRVVETARDDLKDLIAESQEQSEEAAKAQKAFRTELKSHVADLAKELQALGNMAKAFDGVRADMGQAAVVLSRGVRESLVDVKVLLEDWRQTKTQLEGVLSTATHRVNKEFDEQLTSAKQFLSEWDYLLNSRLDLLTGAQGQIQKTLEAVPASLHSAAKAVLAETPDIVDRMTSFRHATATVQQSIADAHEAAERLSAVAPDLSGFKKELAYLSEQAAKARADLAGTVSILGPDIAKIDAVTTRAQIFFAHLQGKTDKHLIQLESVEAVLARLQQPNVTAGALEQLQPILKTVETLNAKCDELEKRAASARDQYEALDLKPLMKSLVLQIEGAFDQSIDVLSAIRPGDSALKARDDLPALTIRLRQVLEEVKPGVLSSAVNSKPTLNAGAQRFVSRFAAIMDEARNSSPQGEWVAAALASSELGKIYRTLQRALETK